MHASSKRENKGHDWYMKSTVEMERGRGGSMEMLDLLSQQYLLFVLADLFPLLNMYFLLFFSALTWSQVVAFLIFPV